MTAKPEVQGRRRAPVRDYVVVREGAGIWSVTNEVVPRPVAQRLAEVLLALWEELPLSMRQMLPEHVEDAEVALAAFGAVFPKADDRKQLSNTHRAEEA